MDRRIFFACTYTQGTLVYSVIQRTSKFYRDCSTFDSGEISWWEQSLEHKFIMFTYPTGDPMKSCLTLAFESECSCSVPQTLQTDSDTLTATVHCDANNPDPHPDIHNRKVTLTLQQTYKNLLIIVSNEL